MFSYKWYKFDELYLQNIYYLNFKYKEIKMHNSVKVILLGLMVLILGGCVEDRQPNTPQFNSGIEKTKEWNDYNKYAKENDQPILDFVATTLKYQPKGKILNYNEFQVNDPRVEVMTKWHNCKSTDVFEHKFYMPDGRLYHYEYYKQKKDYSKFTLGQRIYIENVFPSLIQGKWSVDIFMNNKKVVRKEFYIGDKNITYSKANPNKTIGVFPFLDNQKMSTWKHAKSLSQYISWAILYNNINTKVVPPRLILKNLPNVSIEYDTFESFINEDLKSEDSILLKLANKFKMDYIIIAKIQSAWAASSQDTKVNSLIIDVSNKTIINKKETSYSLYRSDFNIVTQQDSQGIHPQRLKIYKKVYSELEEEIQTLSK